MQLFKLILGLGELNKVYLRGMSTVMVPTLSVWRGRRYHRHLVAKLITKWEMSRSVWCSSACDNDWWIDWSITSYVCFTIIKQNRLSSYEFLQGGGKQRQVAQSVTIMRGYVRGKTGAPTAPSVQTSRWRFDNQQLFYPTESASRHFMFSSVSVHRLRNVYFHKLSPYFANM